MFNSSNARLVPGLGGERARGTLLRAPPLGPGTGGLGQVG